MSTRRKFERQFKIDAVLLLKNSGKTAKTIADDLGIRSGALSRWKRELSNENVRSFPGHGNPRDEELIRLKKELSDTKMERDILKKVVAIFSKPGDKNTNS